MTTPTPAELRELAKVMHGSRMPDSGQCDAAGHALWACADLIERMPDVSKLRRLVETWRAVADEGGMTLRDAAAFAALPTVLSDFYRDARERGYPEGWRHDVAVESYVMADAMLKAREGGR